MINVNNFNGKNDNEVIENAIKHSDGTILIPKRNLEFDKDRDYWLLDRAILIPENTTIVLDNCKIKLSDNCRDNFFRTVNCGMGIDFPKEIQNVHIKGEGLCVLEGAEHPRSTGDSSKILSNPCPYTNEDLCKYASWIPEERRKSGKLEFCDTHSHTYGTDAGNPNESQYGDWRNIGILFANVKNFSVKNIKIVKPHAWAMSFEQCSFGYIEKIAFEASICHEIDGMLSNTENQDGIDLRNGCHDIIISDITGVTGDDVVALTAIANSSDLPGGSLKSTHVMPSDWTRREKGINNIVIRNVVARSYLCMIVRLLACETHIHNVVIDGVVDTATNSQRHWGVLLFGEPDGAYGKNNPDSITNITVSNIICNSDSAIRVEGFLKDSVINNVINKNDSCPMITVTRPNGLNNVELNNVISKSVIEYE